MLGDKVDRLWVKIFIREWIKAGKKLHKLSPNNELARNLQNLYKLYLTL